MHHKRLDLSEVFIGATIRYRIEPVNAKVRIYLTPNDPTPITTLTAPGGEATIPLGEPSTFFWEADEGTHFDYKVVGWKDNLSDDPREMALMRWLKSPPPRGV